MTKELRLRKDSDRPEEGRVYLVFRDHDTQWQVLTVKNGKWVGRYDEPSLSIDWACDRWFPLP